MTQKRNVDDDGKVFIISQLSGKTVDEINTNTEFAVILAKKCYEMGYFPIVPHIYFPQFMSDIDEESREYGIEAGHLLMKLCDVAVVVTVDGFISDGMQKDIDFAESIGVKIKNINVCADERNQIINLERYKV